MGVMILKYLPPFLLERGDLLLLVGAAWAFVMTVLFLQWFCTTYSLTNLRLLEERGIIGSRIVSIGLESVQDITCTFGVFGWIFGFGDIEIESAGTYGKIVFGSVPEPGKLRGEIEKAILDLHERRPLASPM